MLLKLFFYIFFREPGTSSTFFPYNLHPFHNGIAAPGSMHRQLDLIEPQQAAASPEFGVILRLGPRAQEGYIVGIYKY